MTNHEITRERKVTLRDILERTSEGHFNGEKVLSVEDALRLIYQLQVYQMELEMQNEELRRSQLDLENSRDQDSRLFDHAQPGYLTMDRSGRISEVNLALTTLLDYERGRLIGKQFNQLIPPRNQDTFHLFKQRVMKSGGVGTCELNMVRSDGISVFVQLEVGTFSRSLEEPETWKVIVRDLSALWVAATFPVALFKMDPEGRCIFVNSKWREMTGHSSVESMGMGWVEALHPDDRGKVLEAWNHAAKSRIPFEMEFRIGNGDGRAIWVLGQAMAEIDGDGCLTGYVGTFTDITKQKSAELSLLAIQEVAHLGSWNWDLVENTLEWNGEACRIFGLVPQEIPITYDAFLDAVHPNDRNKVTEAVDRALADPTYAYRVDHRIVRPDGQFRNVVERGQVQRDQSGRPVRMLGTVHDVTDLRSMENQLGLVWQVLELTNEGVFISDEKSRIISVNDSLGKLFGYQPEELIGKTPQIFQSHRQDRVFYSRMWKDLFRNKVWEGEIWNRRKDGEVFLVRAAIRAICDEHGDISHFVCIYHDLTDIRRRDEALDISVTHDPLTGLPNRKLFLDRLEQALRHAEREKTRVGVSVLDLDLFKKVNDSLGHVLGDDLLKKVADRYCETIRKEDTVCRLGGDEFAIIHPNVGSAESMAQMTQRLQAGLKEPFYIAGQELHMTASVGLTIFPEDGQEPDVLLKNADSAMNRAKESDRSNFHFFTKSLDERAMRRMTLERTLRAALKRGEFLLHYQPKVLLSSGAINGMESLVRWNPRTGGMVSPAEFIPLAEESGLIVPLGDWIFREACFRAAEWHRRHGRLQVAINLSPRQFREKNLLMRLDDGLRDSGLDPTQLELEITESMVMEDMDHVTSLFRKIKDMGVSIAMDDFGTGHSSLSVLKRFPIDTLKIDQSFIRNLSIDSEDAAIVAAIISMARTLNLKVVAEGVETSAQLEFLMERECDMFQGYFFSKPLEQDHFSNLLESGRGLSLPKQIHSR